MFTEAGKLLCKDELSSKQVQQLLTSVGFVDWEGAHNRLWAISTDESSRQALSECLPILMSSLADAATPDGSLLNLERLAQSVAHRADLFRFLAANPRAVEILIKLFVGSQFLTEILLRNPGYLEQLTRHKRLADFKSRQQLVEEARQTTSTPGSLDQQFNSLRRFQHWELLRIGACDAFGLMDLKTVTIQLSLLADCIVQSCLHLLSNEMQVVIDKFCILAFGKLGGEELNYSSDIDLVFIAKSDAASFWRLGQRLIKALMESTSEGFLYRTDMRLRPWGRAGALVTSVDSYLDYLRSHAQQWEKQALLKARPIAGNLGVGERFLQQANPLMFSAPVEEIRQNVQEMKERIEADLNRQGRNWGEVKSGAGSIRDVEFVTQFLQLAHGRDCPEVQSINTLDGLVRLAEFGFLQGDEYRQLSTGYMFLRTIEHALQLMHHKQAHTLPDDKRELAYLSRRLDFINAEQFMAYYQRHCTAVRAIYDKYVGGVHEPTSAPSAQPLGGRSKHAARMQPSYSESFTAEEIEKHATLLGQIGNQHVVRVEAHRTDACNWRVSVVGYDHPGDLSLICGLLFVHGFDITDGNVFTDDQVPQRPTGLLQANSARLAKESALRKFITVLTLHHASNEISAEVWDHYQDELSELIHLVHIGQRRDAQGSLAKRFARSLTSTRDLNPTLYPVAVEIDNSVSELATVLHIRAEDTSGFLYELSNALAVAGFDILRVIVETVGNRVFDTLFITDATGNKITDDNKKRELRAAVVLIKHFTHLLPRSPNPEAALLHFRNFLEHLFQQPNWLEELSSLERSDVLDALARLLGISNFLWEDFLRLQHSNLFPVVKDIASLKSPKSRDSLEAELEHDLLETQDPQERRSKLNAFKDREMFRIDMRHILGQVTEFGQFSKELTGVAEVVVSAAYRICRQELEARFGIPQLENGQPCQLSICALGKCGGRELGFASDIELMFVYEQVGRTSGPKVITTTEFFLKVVETFTHAIQAKRAGIFEIDLRLRPYGRAGSLAVSLDAFRDYFGADGAAWPYERQALVKLRPIAGDADINRKIVELRDSMMYMGEAFDVAAMRAMREKQVRQLVKAGTMNAKLSPGGLVDCEYLVQGLQITYGHLDASLRMTNTYQAIDALNQAGILSGKDRERLQAAYIFQRRLIDALRMVRGDAHDLTVPVSGSEELEFLARRLGYEDNVSILSNDLELHTQNVHELGNLLDLPHQA